MPDIYDIISKGIQEEENINHDEFIERLKQLQYSVRLLRNAYRSYPVCVSYEKTDIQAAYLLAYFPHYYQLIYKILIEDHPSIFAGKKRVKLIYFGGGPGPEIYGTIKYISNNRPDVDFIEVLLFDINAVHWKYSHNILENHLLPEITNSNLNVNLKFNYCDLGEPLDYNMYDEWVSDCDLLVFQNCLNEIAPQKIMQLKDNIDVIFKLIPDKGSLLLADLTGGYAMVSRLLENIESILIHHESVSALHSIIENNCCKTIISVHHKPSAIITDHLLIGEDGLIPRKWIKYNYCFLLKSINKTEKETPQNGLQALYSPLNFANIDVNNYIQRKSFVGIDFGTSSTVVSLAYVRNGEITTETIPIIQKDPNGHICKRPLMNSAIALKSSRLLFGCHAHELKSELIKNVDIWHSFKLELGADNYKDYSESVLYNDPDYPIRCTQDVVTLFFKYLKSEIVKFINENNFPEEMDFAVSIPASFLESERRDLLNCLEKSNIVVGNNPFLDEPIAAVISCLIKNDDPDLLENDQKIMVIDNGAGTCDISIIEIGKKSTGVYSKNLSISRFGNIGGKLLDQMIAERILIKQLLDQNEEPVFIDSSDKNSIIDAIAYVGEKLKIKLCKSFKVCPSSRYKLPRMAQSSNDVWITDEQIRTNGKVLRINSPAITYDQFHSIMKDYTLFNRPDNPPKTSMHYSIATALEKANMKKEDVTHVLLTGGGMRNPYLRSFISEYFDKSDIIIPDNLQEHVSKGVAIHSLVLNSFGANLISPILSDSLCINDNAGMHMVFPAGTEIPSVDKKIEIKVTNTEVSKIDVPIYYSGINRPLKVISFDVKPERKYCINFFITPEKWLDCEVLENKAEIPHEVSYSSKNRKLENFTVKN